MTPEQFLLRARGAVGKGTKYRLGAGGMNALARLPGNALNECDCSGYVCWAMGMARLTTHPMYVRFNGGWINTDAMYYDGYRRQAGFFELLPNARAGALIVYPAGKRGVGHVGIVTAVDAQRRATRVLHCSAGNYRKGDAIAETPPDVFKRPETVHLWFSDLGEPG
jgi:cell wall-associated NlpC family hydrolase